MAGTIPTPRSYQSIVGDMISTFLSRFGGTTLKVGGPLLSILESAAQSDVRGTQDIFNLLDSNDVDRAEGIALDQLAADEDITRQPLTPSSGSVNVIDTSFTKVSTKVYPGAAAPNAGTMVIKVSDASKFPATGGSLYIGRNTNNFEGPINYTATAIVGTFWTITLSTPTQKYHDVNEAVTLAQGGNRTIAAGQVVQTPQGNVSAAVTFATLVAATIPDGETEVDGISVICQQAGTIGNVAFNSITQFQSKPFSGATVTNPLPFSNGMPAQSDASLRETIKAARQSRSKGTPLALITNATGVQAPDENKSVISATVVQIQGQPATLFIDDGTGYEETNQGVSFETLVDSALGGETYFSLAGDLPVTKAFALSTLSAPFSLVAGATLAVEVAGVLTEHSFSVDEFLSIGNATAYEVMAAINGDPSLLWSARTANNETQVVVFARSDVNEDVSVVPPNAGIDANTFLGFPSGINYTLRLYKNDILLFKDGESAIITTQPQSSWSSTITSGYYIKVQVDGTPALVYKIVDLDFVNANTGYTSSAATNSLAAWAAVFNYRIPGITCTVNGDALQFVSNRNASSLASLVFSAPLSTDVDTTGASVGANASHNFVVANMFSSSLSATGRNNDYTLNRNTGEGKLSIVLAAGDKLTAGTNYPRAYLQTPAFTNAQVTLTGAGGRIWFVADGAAQQVKTGVNAGTSFTTSTVATNLVKYTASAAVFQNVLFGDWMIVWDPNFIANGAWRVVAVDPAWTWVEVERSNGFINNQSGILPASNGISFVRTTKPVQVLHIPNGTNVPLTTIVSQINSQALGATASVYRNKYMRLTTDRMGSKGDIFVAAADIQGQQLQFPTNILVTNNSNHLPSVESGSSEAGTTNFTTTVVTFLNGQNGFTFSGTQPTVDKLLAWNRRETNLYGTNVGKDLPISFVGNIGGTTTVLPHSQYPVLSINTGGLNRSFTTVTVTTVGSHGFQVGDLVYLGAVGTQDGNFGPGIKNVTSVPSSNTWTYSEGGAGGPSILPYACTYDAGLLTGDRLWLASPYSIGPYDNLTVVLDGNSTTKNYNIPMARNIVPAPGFSYTASGLAILDADNGNVALSSAFGSGFDMSDYVLYMHARGKSHGGSGGSAPIHYHYNKGILWRYARMGPEGNNVRVAYINPTQPSASLALSTRNGAFADIKVQLPSGAARTGLSLFNTTKFTFAVTTTTFDSVVVTYSKPVVTLVRVSPTVTATTASAHGFAIGDVVYISGVDANFPAGPKTVVTTPTGTTFTYIESGANASSTGSLNVSSASADPILTGATVGDLVTIAFGNNAGTYRTTAISATSFTYQAVASTQANITTPVSIGSTANLTFFPITATAAGSIVSYINANQSALVTAVAVENGGGFPGTGLIDRSTLDEFLASYGNTTSGSSVLAWPFEDGVNYVQSSALTSSPNLLNLKNAVNSDLTSNADYSNEKMALVPVTAAKVSAYISSSAVAGFYAGSEVDAIAYGNKVQLSSLTVGSEGSIQVTGGTANSVGALITGAGSVVDTSYTLVTVPATQAKGLLGGQFVAVQAVNTQNKVSPLGPTNTIAIAAAVTPGQWTITFNTAVSTIIQQLTSTSDAWQMDRQGRFVRYTLIGPDTLSGVVEGSWVKIKLNNGTNSATGQTGALSANVGTFLVVRADTTGFWIENTAGVSDYVTVGAGDSVTFLTYDSVIEGDTVAIDTADFGTLNRGAFTVVDATTSTTAVTVVGSMQPLTSTTIGTTDLPYIRFVEGTPIRLIKRIWTIGQNASNAAFSDIIFDTTQLAPKLSSGAACSILPLDKLGFSTSLTAGADAYTSATGLIGEVNKVIYGDPTNPSVYPGVVAAGAQVNISGPLVRRVQVGLEIRVAKGATVADVEARVQSAVASVINQVPLGTSVDIGAIVAAARGTSGVTSVAVTSPTYGAGSDLIPIQADEKARVLNIAQDILVSTVGS